MGRETDRRPETGGEHHGAPGPEVDRIESGAVVRSAPGHDFIGRCVNQGAGTIIAVDGETARVRWDRAPASDVPLADLTPSAFREVALQCGCAVVARLARHPEAVGVKVGRLVRWCGTNHDAGDLFWSRAEAAARAAFGLSETPTVEMDAIECVVRGMEASS